ncbi:MAG: AAA family ATPase [Leptolyngbyaceae bacterium]|nr:AAA family ATPase [Leptolyngbyaceae bacterium]
MISPVAGYQWGKLLHEDSSTVMYRGWRDSAIAPVLLKFLKAEYPTLEDIARFKHEYEILQSLEVAGVIKPYALETDRTFVLVLEDIGGMPLSTLLSQRSLSLHEFLAIAIQLTETLGQIHQQQVIHKNVKTANVLFNSLTGQVKLVDFSLATRLSRESQTVSNPHLLEGTLAYLSPEQTGRMNRSIDYRTDFYSLGVVFYELLTGQLPFQSTDPLELVHCHLAKTPFSPKKMAQACGLPEIPQAISDLVMKLLAKAAEDRYQNALGLKADLETCLEMLETTGKIRSFPVGQLDLYSQFSIPQKLYGRESEVATLMAAFDRISQGAAELMLVSGYSGIGKSSLVYEVHKPIARQRGFFIAGKFDQFKRNIPYAALIQAFQELMRQLLTEPEERIHLWQTKLLAALGANAQVIIDVIPEVEHLMGPQPAVPELGASEAKNRFHRVFQQFIQVFCQPEHPLVLFLDDLQWADSASLKLIQLLVSDPKSQYLLLIGAYRDNEVSATHPLMLTLDEIYKTSAVIQNIVLQPLLPVHVSQLVADTLHLEQESLADCKLADDPGLPSDALSQLVFDKTQGNPFFLSQLLKSLYQDHWLWFDFDLACWQWDRVTLQGIGITDNVVELMASRIQKLLPTTQDALKLAACIGDTFTLEVLSIVSEKSLSETAKQLWEALQSGLVLPLSQSYKIPLVLDLENSEPSASQPAIAYKFLHDRVQQAAYSLIPAEEKSRVHLQIGELLLAHTPEAELENNIFEIVNQMNSGVEFITSPSAQERLAELNFIAGQKAKGAIAYEPALRYLTCALNLLSADSWTHQYQLTLDIYDAAIEAEYLTINYPRSKVLIDIALEHVKTRLDQVRIYKRTIQFYIAQANFSAAIDTALDILEKLGVVLPTTPEEITFYCENLQQDLTFETDQIAALADLPEMSDATKRAAMEILNTMPGPVYISRPILFMPMMLCMAHLSVHYGNCDRSTFAYAAYGMLLCGAATPIDLDRGYEFGQLALRLLDKFDNKVLRSHVLKVYASHIQHAKEPIQAAIATLKLATESAIETGNLEFIGYGSSEYGIYSFFDGENLDTVNQKLLPYVELVESFKQELGIYYIRIARQVILNFIERSPNPHQLTGESFNEETMLPIVMTANWRTLLFCFYLFKLMLAYVFRDYAAALTYATEAQQYLDGVGGMMMNYEFTFYHSLTLLQACSNSDLLGASSEENIRDTYLHQVELNQEILQYRATHAPSNFRHKYELVEAEKARVVGQWDRAMEYYDLAIQHAQAQGHLQEAALAAELAAIFYASRRRERVAQDYLTDAYYGYVRWGAKAKVQELSDRYPHLFTPHSASTSPALPSTYTTELGLATLDLATVIKASQVISDEIVLDKLLDKLMNSLIENAGARTGILLLQETGQWSVVAEGFADQHNVMVLPPKPLETAANLPASVIYYVIHHQAPLVLDNATQSARFAGDAYIQTYRPQSILCLPIVYQAQLKGIFYLENNLTQGAFTQHHVEVLSLLASQVAISLENAKLYQALHSYSQKLESKNLELNTINASLAAEIKERQRIEQEREELLIREQQARIAAEQANRVKDEFLAVLSHELRTPLGPILGWVQFLRTRKLDSVATDRALATIERNARLQTSLIEDLLDISRILQGKLSMTVNPVNPAHILGAAIETVQLSANAKSIQIQTHLDATVGQVLGDANRLQQVFWNLLSNAIRFTPEGGQVAVSLERQEAYAQIQVSDTGRGISPEFLPLVFESFRQADSSTTRTLGGLGLGLAIARHLVELHGGTVKAESPGEGLGAVFTVKLPLIKLQEQPLEEEGTLDGSSSHPLKDLKILVVEDEADMHELIRYLLEEFGAHVISATSGIEALRSIAQTKPDLVLSDIGMADMDGYTLMRQIRASSPEQGGDIPAIALTAFASETDQQQALAAGYQRHLAKPINPDELMTAITGLVNV